ncbi:MAG: DoxX family membrane protein [Pseudonocardia sp.]|nr:DoxX family membrane protein [Pseudonocardia sp.]
MEIGLLILRLGLAALLFGHGAQKMFGWFGGLGPTATGGVFAQWGLRPGRLLVLLAAGTELLSSLLLALGLLTALGAALAIGAMTVAASVTAANGLWAQKGGFELPLVYAGIAAGIAFTGPGPWSIDAVTGLTGLTGTGWGAAALVVGLAPGAAIAAYGARNRRTATTTATSAA